MVIGVIVQRNFDFYLVDINGETGHASLNSAEKGF